jgi:hypothetical protein
MLHPVWHHLNLTSYICRYYFHSHKFHVESEWERTLFNPIKVSFPLPIWTCFSCGWFLHVRREVSSYQQPWNDKGHQDFLIFLAQKYLDVKMEGCWLTCGYALVGAVPNWYWHGTVYYGTLWKREVLNVTYSQGINCGITALGSSW